MGNHYKTLAINALKLDGCLIPEFAVTYHQQNDDPDNNLFCGPASGQMILNSISRPGLYQQEFLYEKIREFASIDAGPDWHAAPDRLTAVLNAFKPDDHPEFKCWSLDSFDAISRKICWSIQHHGRAAIALVQGGGHWVVVVGFESDREPVSASDTTYKIISFDLYNPGPAAEWGVDPPPHRIDERDMCGTGTDETGKNHGIEYENARLEKWGLEYMLEVKVGKEWEGSYVAICDMDKPTEAKIAFSVSDAGDLIREDRIHLITQRAVLGVEAFIANGRAPWANAYRGTKPGTPILVERVGVQPFPFFYLVPFIVETHFAPGYIVPLVASVGAYTTGHVTGVIATPPTSPTVRNRTTHFSRALDLDAVARGNLSREVTVLGHRVRLNPETQLFRDHLVWFPSIGSLTPYHPFYQFNVPTPSGIGNVHVRIDGKLFSDLQPWNGMRPPQARST